MNLSRSLYLRPNLRLAWLGIFAVVVGCFTASLPAQTPPDQPLSLGAVEQVGDPPIGLDMNAWMGANTFYHAGYTGSRAVVANLESSLVWNGHESLAHVTTFLYAGSRGVPQVDWHPTAVAGLIGGRPTPDGDIYQEGIAPGATLWSGGHGFGDDIARATPYYRAMQLGVKQRRADVVNASWGTLLYDPAATEPNPAIMIDALVAANHQTFVCAAGNAGPGSNTITPPGSCYNTLAVAALAGPAYKTLADFSSRGGSDYLNPVTGQTLAGVRATIDLAAPGDMLLMPIYIGNHPAPDTYGVSKGTSFASPLVAGGAALLADVGYDRFGGQATDGRVIQSVLQNAARPIEGWDNGARRGTDGVWRTTQSLDFASGAGIADLERSFHQYTDGTTDLPGLAGGTVKTVGWDYASVHENRSVDYRIDMPIAGEFRGTLNWWIDRSVTFTDWGSDYKLGETSENSFVNLDLELWRLSDQVPTGRMLVAASQSLYNNTELIRLALDEPGTYFLRVLWAGKNYDRLGTTQDVDFGLAWWSTPVPEPLTVLLLLAGGAAIRLGCRSDRRWPPA